MLKNIFLLLIITLVIHCATVTTEEQASYLIRPPQFQKMMCGEDVVVLDVRTPEEVAMGVIGSPLKINYRDVDFKEQLKALDKSKTYLVYCKGGGRSAQTKLIMDTNGFDLVYDLKGGITTWKIAGLPID